MRAQENSVSHHAAFGSYLTYVTHCRTKHRTARHVTYIRAWFRAAGSGPLTYIPPGAAAGRGNTSARTRATGCELVCGSARGSSHHWIFWTENGLCAAPSELRNVSISCCDIAGFSVMTVAAARASRWSQCGRELGERAVVAPLHCGLPRARLLTYPPSLARWLCHGLTYLPPLFGAAVT